MKGRIKFLSILSPCRNSQISAFVFPVFFGETANYAYELPPSPIHLPKILLLFILIPLVLLHCIPSHLYLSPLSHSLVSTLSFRPVPLSFLSLFILLPSHPSPHLSLFIPFTSTPSSRSSSTIPFASFLIPLSTCLSPHLDSYLQCCQILAHISGQYGGKLWLLRKKSSPF